MAGWEDGGGNGVGGWLCYFDIVTATITRKLSLSRFAGDTVNDNVY